MSLDPLASHAPDDLRRLRLLIEQHGLAAAADAILEGAGATYAVSYERLGDAGLPRGSSRAGGGPDLADRPPDLPFVAQLNLADVAGLAPHHGLPAAGLVSIFCSEFGDDWHVQFTPEARLGELRAHAARPGLDTYSPCRMALRPRLYLPQPFSVVLPDPTRELLLGAEEWRWTEGVPRLVAGGMSQEEAEGLLNDTAAFDAAVGLENMPAELRARHDYLERYWGLLSDFWAPGGRELTEPVHKVFGAPYGWQGDVEQPLLEQVAPEDEDEEFSAFFLMQLGADEAPGFEFVDMGTIHIAGRNHAKEGEEFDPEFAFLMEFA